MIPMKSFHGWITVFVRAVYWTESREWRGDAGVEVGLCNGIM